MRVLVVDDHLPTIELMRLTLTTFGHSVVTASNVADALRFVGNESPHLVLSDLTFSSDNADLDGYAFAREVRSNPANAEVAMVAISGITSPAALQKAFDSGFDDVVVKPFDIEALMQRITELGRESTQR